MPTKTLRSDIPLLDVATHDVVEVFSTVAFDPATGEQVSLERGDARVVTGWFSGNVVSIKPVNPGFNEGFDIVLHPAVETRQALTLRTSWYNRKVRLL